jgi:ribosomal protection tetracycline resistance protein
VMLPKLRQIEEEDPQLHILWNEQTKEIQVQIMGEVQLEILQSTIQSRFGIGVSFDSGRIVYKETIADTVEGVGHFEPLRHYAEVHLLLEPGERGSGLHFKVQCSDDILGKSWKNLVLSHLEEKAHKGVLTGSEITDMTITLVSGRANNKHTQGGDFREATWRAVRQGLKQAQPILLEPYYAFELELPENMVGRAMTDLEKMHGTCRISSIGGGTAILVGHAPVVTMKNYQMEVTAYTRGLGRLFCTPKGYDLCHNAQEIIESMGYDSERDVENPTGSVFCANGVGFLVPWDEVKEHMHLESFLQQKSELPQTAAEQKTVVRDDGWLEPEEVDRIFKQTFFANQKEKTVWQKRKPIAENYLDRIAYNRKLKEIKEEYLLVDGYNIIFAWPDLKELAQENMDGARTKLLDMLSKYQGIQKCSVIVVFDAYRVARHQEEILDYDNIHVVFTRTAQTADQYIERFAHDNQNKYAITVATSDGLQQIIIRGAGCALLSARELREEIDRSNESVLQAYRDKKPADRSVIKDVLSEESKQQIEDLLNDS